MAPVFVAIFGFISLFQRGNVIIFKVIFLLGTMHLFLIRGNLKIVVCKVETNQRKNEKGKRIVKIVEN